MDNAKLAFLRAYNMKEYFDQKIYLLNNAKDVSFGFYSYTQSDPTLNSGYYRKVSIGIKIFGDETEEVEEQDTKIGDIELWKWLLGLLAVLLTTIFIKPIELHYKRWREKEDEQKPYEKDRRLFFLFITLTLIVLFAILYVIFILL